MQNVFTLAGEYGTPTMHASDGKILIYTNTSTQRGEDGYLPSFAGGFPEDRVSVIKSQAFETGVALSYHADYYDPYSKTAFTAFVIR
jgi:hypothetical protein